MSLTGELDEEREMTYGDLVAEEVPELPAELRDRVLWEYTAFPFDDPEKVRQQLRKFRERWLREGEFWDPLEGVEMPPREDSDD